MKKIKLLSILLITSSVGFAQPLTEVIGINIFEHHFSGCGACWTASLGDSSAYDFVSHQHLNAISPLTFDTNRDMVEHNGDANSSAPFGFTSDSSSVWAGSFGGNGTTKYFLAPGFDYTNATESSIVSAYNAASASTDIDVVQVGEVYIAKIRNLDYYVVLTITGYQTISDNDFIFDYKYTQNPIPNVGIIENDQAASLAVYPNPTNNEINIQLDKTYKDISISIATINGTRVLFKQFNDRDLINLDLGKLSNGVYFITSLTDGKRTQMKLVKED
ncbi:MAG: T9SS type A sorting domain-containing protein [Crocinitomicaceae bacterium]|nr:T9SS type A sorting domain-containing protein [Flavobacteriales bacterium]NQZ38426.1 T9SS type A sorting domain-containing protein [Crocinitomicaceae bacterium]